MATVLDLGIISFFVPALVLVLVFIIFYGLFEKFKLFGEEKGLHALIAIIFALLFVIVKPLRELITTLTPWFVIFFFLIFIILLGIMMLGLKEKDITTYVTHNSGVLTTVIIIIVIIFILGLRTISPESIGYPTNGGVLTDFRKIVFHPKVLGFLLVFLIAYFVTRGIGQKN